MANEKIIFDTEVKVGSSVGSVKSLKAELRAVTNELGNLEEGSAAFVAAAQKAGQLKDKISDVKNVVNAFNPEAKFKALGDAVGIAANGFAAVQGAMALMGSESEDLNKVIAKTQGAIALATGLNGLLGMKDAFGVLKLTSVTTFNQIRTSAIAAFSTLKGAMAATGIGALVVALGYLVTKFIETSAANEEATKKEKEYAEETKKTKEATDEKVRSIELEIIAIQNKTNAAGANLINAKAEKAVLEEQINAAKLHNAELIKTGNERFANGQSALFEVDALEKNLKTKNEEINSLEKIATKTTELEKVKKDADDAEKLRLKNIKDELDKKNAIENAAIDKRNQDRKDEQLLKNKEQDDIAKKIDLDNKTEAENDKIALDKHIFSLKEISTNDRLSYDERLAAFRQLAAEKIITATQLKDGEVAIEKEKAEKQIEIEKSVAEAKRQIQDATLNSAQSVISILQSVNGQSKEIQAAALIGESAIGIAKMVIANNAANIAALATPQAIATSGLSAIPVITMNNISTALGVAANIAATAKGLGALGKGGAPTGNVTPASIPRIPQSISGTMMNQNKPLDMNNVSNPTGKVIVVETDITNTQNKVKNIIRKATIK
jgi:hypothetical protein